MPHPNPDWLDALPRDRLIAEISTWSADLGRLSEDLARIAPYTDIFHVDVADGHFAPALLFFPDLVARLRRDTDKPIHIHLMVADAILMAQTEQFLEAGADLVSVHAENGDDVVNAAFDSVAAAGRKAGLVLKLETPVARAEPHLKRIDMLTLLGTAIGVKGQGLAEEAPARLTEAKGLIAKTGRRIVLAADGGIRDHTVPRLRAGGAETVVMGSLAFGAPDLPARFAWLAGL
jgi:ribulose-phosphate 3-epimerase